MRATEPRGMIYMRHIARKGEVRNAYKIFVGKPEENNKNWETWE
jgi:hypothetical protein